MSKQASPAAIGGFVISGAALLVLFVLIIAGDSFFKDEEQFVVYFKGTIFGLNVGSNVMFRGVPIGYVRDIDVLADFNSMEFAVPVYLNIVTDNIREIEGETFREAVSSGEDLDEMIKLGLRASLASESLITGQLYIELDFHPGTEIILAGLDDDVAEIPSIPSGIQEVIANAQRFVAELQGNLDIPKLANDLARIMAGIESFVNSDSTQNLTADLSATLAALNTTLDNLNSAIDTLEGDVDPVAESLVSTLEQAEKVLAIAEAQLRDDSDFAYRLGGALKEVENAARAIRMLAEQLEQQPESVLKGSQ
jgi:paraquat-inducible protein B